MRREWSNFQISEFRLFSVTRLDGQGVDFTCPQKTKLNTEIESKLNFPECHYPKSILWF